MNERTDLSRLDDLESRQAFQDDSIARLTEALVSQELRIAQLEKMLAYLVERLRGSEQDISISPDEPPPHY